MKLPEITPEDSAGLTFRDVSRLEKTTPALGGATTFDGSDDPTSGHMNAQAIQLMNNMSIIRHRNPSGGRNSLLSCLVDNSTGQPDFISVSGTDVTIETGAGDTPVVLSYAYSIGRNGPCDFIGVIEEDTVIDATPIMASNGNYGLFAHFNTETSVISLNWGAKGKRWEISNVEPTPSGVDEYWYHPMLGEAYVSIETSPGIYGWEQVCAILLGIVNVSGTTLTPRCSEPGPTQSDVVPSGSVTAYAGATIPNGWLLCQGQDISRAIYARLFDVIGTTFGVGDGSTTFTLPDLRGEFIRGFDNARGVDTGRVFGSAQADEVKSHTHTVPYHTGAGAAGGGRLAGHNVSDASLTTSAYGGVETRPRNIAMNFIIKI